MKNFEDKMNRVSHEQSFPKLHALLKLEELKELLTNKKITVKMNIADAFSSYGFLFRENDFFDAQFKNGDRYYIVIKSVEDTNYDNIKNVSLEIEENK